jgi:hypothetical protein
MTSTEFVDYVMSFYGSDGIYPMGATEDMIQEATQKYINDGGDFCGDSFDREFVRDIMIQDYDLIFPTVPIRKVAHTP